MKIDTITQEILENFNKQFPERTKEHDIFLKVMAKKLLSDKMKMNDIVERYNNFMHDMIFLIDLIIKERKKRKKK